VNGEPFTTPFGSVGDDALFDGQEFEFPLNRAFSRGDSIDPNTAGLWMRGDTMAIKWCTIDEAHYNFWQTFDFNRNSGGPFSSYTRVTSNVDGALGVWGGYSVFQWGDVVPPL